MATNGAGGKAGDIEANEATGLLGTSSPDTGSQGSSENENLWDEMERPWPATFERSISLLASPIINATEADSYTKSPKPGNTPLAIRRRMRGPETPDGLLLPNGRGFVNDKFKADARAFGSERGAVPMDNNLDLYSTKENLRMQAKLIPLADAQTERERKAKEAAEYRAKILKQAKGKQVELSPAFGRERASIAHSKKQKAEAKAQESKSEGKATFMQCVFNLANILMGVGLLGLPYACAQAGMAGGVFALLSFSFITWKTSIMIGRELNGDPRPASYFVDTPWKTPLQPGSVPEARMRKPISSFPDIARSAFGEAGCILLSVILYFELFSCICIFIVTIGDHMHTLFPSIPVTTHMLGVGVVSVIPILLLRTARLLSYLSAIGTVATICVVGAVVLAFVFEGNITEDVAERMADPPPPPYHTVWRTSGLPMAFGMVAYCFSGHAIVPSIYSSMEKPQDFERVVNLTYSIVLVACLAVGLSGYLMFGDLVFDQVTISLEQNSSAELAMTILTYLMILTAFSKITLTMFPLAIGMEEIFAPFLSSERGISLLSAVIKIVLIVLALWVAIYVPSFSFLCSLVGMICTMTVSVVFPAGAYLNLFGHTLSLCEKLMYWAFVVIGLLMAVVGTALSVG